MNPLTVTFFLELAISSVKLVNLGFYLHPSASYRFLIFISYLNFDFCSCYLAKCRQCQELDGIRKHRGLDFILHWRNMNKISTRFNLKTYKLEFVNLMT